MSWKKDIFSYLLWLIYALAVGLGFAGAANAVCGFAGIPIYWGIAVSVVYIALAGGCVFLLHRIFSAPRRSGEKEQFVGAVIEASLMVVILAVGLVLRVNGMGEAGEKAAYFQAAAVVQGQSVPQVVQGSVYLYLQLLHGVFYFLGNKLMAGVWLQIFLQLGAVLLLYFVVRHCAGRIGAMIFLCFGMFSSYMVREALLLSPEMLYLLLWSAVLLWVVVGSDRKIGIPDTVFTGLLLAAACYLDVAGVFLFLAAAAVWFCEREEERRRGRIRTGALGALVFVLGFAGCVLGDAVFSGKTFVGVLEAWRTLYWPKGFSIPMTMEEALFPAELILLPGLMIFGVFGFWRDKERDRMKGWIAGACVVVLLGCTGSFTAQMPAGVYLYFLMLMLAGLGAEECCRSAGQIKAENEKTDDQDFQFLWLGDVPDARREPERPGMIENPLPLPKKHVSRLLDYDRKNVAVEEGYDVETDEDDDFDI